MSSMHTQRFFDDVDKFMEQLKERNNFALNEQFFSQGDCEDMTTSTHLGQKQVTNELLT